MTTLQVLDHGYVNLVEHWGSDERIIESARMSTNKGFVDWVSDQKLLKYLYRNGHTSPFEQCGMTVEVYAPLMVTREWQRHRTQSYNELSGRYTQMPTDCYLPDSERVKPQSTTNKQSSEGTLDPAIVKQFLANTEHMYSIIKWFYDWSIQNGIAREQARLIIPLGNYTRFRASANLKNWLDFLRLRLGEGAQEEIRDYAKAVATILEEHFPRTMELFNGQT